jgi:hypothetical protein
MRAGKWVGEKAVARVAMMGQSLAALITALKAGS